MYNKRSWLNPEGHPSCGSVVAYDGSISKDKEDTFLAVSDCYSTVRLHMIEGDTYEDFINKMEILRDNIDEFINYLKSKENGRNN